MHRLMLSRQIKMMNNNLWETKQAERSKYLTEINHLTKIIKSDEKETYKLDMYKSNH